MLFREKRFHNNFQCITTQFKTSQSILGKFCFFIVQSHSFNRHFCADYFKLTIFQKKKQFVKNGTLTNFSFMGSRKWFVIHKSNPPNSKPDILGPNLFAEMKKCFVPFFRHGKVKCYRMELFANCFCFHNNSIWKKSLKK